MVRFQGGSDLRCRAASADSDGVFLCGRCLEKVNPAGTFHLETEMFGLDTRDVGGEGGRKNTLRLIRKKVEWGIGGKGWR